MTWKRKLELLKNLSFELKKLHSYRYVHGDLHSDNIVQRDLNNVHIMDFEFAFRPSEQNKSTPYGNVPFIAPEVFNNGRYDYKSDIYSFGIIAWEIAHGKSARQEFNSDHLRAILDLINGDRLPIDEQVPSGITYVIKRCWEGEPEKRMSADDIYKYLADKIYV